MMGILHGDRDDHRDVVLSEVAYQGRQSFMVRTERHKYAMDSSGRGYALYDLLEDPLELNNLVDLDKQHDLVQQMRDHLLRRLTSTEGLWLDRSSPKMFEPIC